MFSIDKQQFGAFVSQLRREKGYTQKELAERLYVSDKTVSKWETGASIPDPALLIPLAELLGVTATELLLCRRQTAGETLDPAAVEALVQSMIGYDGGRPERAWEKRSPWQLWYLLCLLICLGALAWSLARALPLSTVWTAALLGAIFGAYFCFFAPLRLPGIYDHSRTGLVYDGPFRMNLAGLAVNNRNWPYLLTVGRAWSCAVMVLLPAISLLGGAFLSPTAELVVTLALVLGGLFVPLYVVGKRYE